MQTIKKKFLVHLTIKSIGYTLSSGEIKNCIFVLFSYRFVSLFCSCLRSGYMIKKQQEKKTSFEWTCNFHWAISSIAHRHKLTGVRKDNCYQFVFQCYFYAALITSTFCRSLPAICARKKILLFIVIRFRVELLFIRICS